MSEIRDIDWTNPKTFGLSDEEFVRYENNNTCLHNSVARDNPDKDFLFVMAEHKGSHDEIRIGGKSIYEAIGSL
jgi:hypothetical protein